MAAVRHLELFKYANFYCPNGLQWQLACSCKISPPSVARLHNMAAVRHIGLVVRMLGTTHDVLLVVFITVQNFVEIGTVILIM